MTLRPKDAPADGAAPAARTDSTGSTVSRSLSERARRLDSFKRLLSRARGGAGSSSDLQAAAEETPLQADTQLPCDADSQEQQQQQLALGASIRQQQHASAAQQGQAHVAVCGLDQQQQQHLNQWAPTPHDLSPYESSEAVHSMHHRHTHALLHVGSSSSSGSVLEQPPHPHEQQQQQQWVQPTLASGHVQHQSKAAAGLVRPETPPAGVSGTSALN